MGAPAGASPAVPVPGNQQGSLPAPSAQPPAALGTLQGDQQPVLQVDPSAGDLWRKIAIAGVPTLLPSRATLSSAASCLQAPCQCLDQLAAPAGSKSDSSHCASSKCCVACPDGWPVSAAIVILLVLVCAVLGCILCQHAARVHLEAPLPKPAKSRGKGRYQGMKEFEMPEIKGASTGWGMP
jgi:hypothetical protein